MSYPQFYHKNRQSWAVVLGPKDYIEVSTLNTSRQLLFGPSDVYVEYIRNDYSPCRREIFLQELTCRFADLLEKILPFYPAIETEEVLLTQPLQSLIRESF